MEVGDFSCVEPNARVKVNAKNQAKTQFKKSDIAWIDLHIIKEVLKHLYLYNFKNSYKLHKSI